MVDNTKFMSQLLSTMQNIEKAVSGGSASGTGYASINTDIRSVLSAAQQLRQETNGAADGVNRFVASLDQTAVKFREQGKMVGLLSTTFDQLDKASGRIMSKIGDKTGVNKVVKGFKEGGKALKEWGSAFKNAENAVSRIHVLVDGFTSLLGKGVGLVGSIAGGFLSLGKTLANSVISVLGNALTMAGKFAEFAVTLPIDIANKASELGGKIREELVETIQSAVEKTKDLFDTASNSGDAFTKLGSIAKGSLLSFQSVGSTMTKLFGYGAQGAANMVSIISGKISEMGVFSEVFAKSTTNSAKSIEFLQRMTEGLGMKGADLNYVVAEAMKNGEHYFETLTRMKESMDTVSSEFGVNRKRLSANFFELRKDITQFGHLTDIQLQRTAASAMQLGIEMKDVAGVFNKFSTFEDAANSAALLQQTFGMNIDALQLIRAENPMEIIEMFRQSMLMTGRSFDDLNRHEKALMAQHTGMSVEALKQIMNYRTLGKSYEDIKKIMNDQKPEERQIRAMKDMKTSMAEIQKIMNKKDFFKAFFDGFSKTIMYGTEFGDAMIKVNKAMENFYEHGLKSADKDLVNSITAPFKGILDEIVDIFSTKGLGSLVNEILGNIKAFVADVTNPEKCFDDATIGIKWRDKTAGLFDFSKLADDKSFLGRLTKITGKIIGWILRGFSLLGPGLIRGIGDAIKSVVKFLKTGSISESFDSESLKKFLGFDDKCWEGIKKDFEFAFQDIKAYLFGGKTKKIKFGDLVEVEEKGLFKQLFGDFTGADGIFATLGEKLKVTIKSAFDIKDEDDIFMSIGQKIMAGISSATEHITTLAGSIMDGIKAWMKTNSPDMFSLMFGDAPPAKPPTIKIGDEEIATGVTRDSGTTTVKKLFSDGVGEATKGLADIDEVSDYEGVLGTLKKATAYTLGSLPSKAWESTKNLASKGVDKTMDFFANLFGTSGGASSVTGAATKKGISKLGGIATLGTGLYDGYQNAQGAAARAQLYQDAGLITAEQANEFLSQANIDQAANTAITSVTTVGGGALGAGFLSIPAAVLGGYAGELLSDMLGYENAQESLIESMIAEGVSKDAIAKVDAAFGRMSAAQEFNESASDSGIMLRGLSTKDNISSLDASTRTMMADLPSDHPLKQLAGLTGNQTLDKKDIDALFEDREKNAKLIESLVDYFKNNKEQVVVTVDGYALGAHLTTVQRQQAANRSLSPGTDSSAMASNSASLSTNGIG